jgi:hypothetical protein
MLLLLIMLLRLLAQLVLLVLVLLVLVLLLLLPSSTSEAAAAAAAAALCRALQCAGAIVCCGGSRTFLCCLLAAQPLTAGCVAPERSTSAVLYALCLSTAVSDKYSTDLMNLCQMSVLMSLQISSAAASKQCASLLAARARVSSTVQDAKFTCSSPALMNFSTIMALCASAPATSPVDSLLL